MKRARCPTHFAKREMCCRHGSEHRRKIELKDRRGDLKASPPARDDQDVPSWPTGSVTTDICSWMMFRRTFWKHSCSKLMLPDARHDVCRDCFILANLSRCAGGAMASRNQFDAKGVSRQEAQLRS
jgi:hypothetical protein